LNPFS